MANKERAARGARRLQYEIEFYEDEHGDQPVRRWLKEELTPRQRRAIGYAMSEVLQHLGVNVCGTEFGKQIGSGLFEFRLRRDLGAISGTAADSPAGGERVLLRVFCHGYGNRVILLLAGYDKGSDTSAKRERAEIALARKRLGEWRRRRERRGS